MMQAEYTGNKAQIFKFTYCSADGSFIIQPANCYNVDQTLTLSSAGDERADRRALLYDLNPAMAHGRFWVVKREVTTDCYKIVPVTSYGVMTLTDRYTGNTHYVNQYYTGMSTGDVALDIWQFVSTTRIFDENEITRYEQDTRHWCWVAASKTAASVETPFYGTISQRTVVELIMGPNSDEEEGNQSEKAQASNYYVSQNLNSGKFVAVEDHYYSEAIVRRFIMDGHVINMSVRTENNGSGHALVLMGFEWVDMEESGEIGYYMYYFLDPWSTASSEPQGVFYTDLTKYSDDLLRNGTMYVWKHSVVYSTNYVNQSTLFTEEGAY